MFDFEHATRSLLRVDASDLTPVPVTVPDSDTNVFIDGVGGVVLAAGGLVFRLGADDTLLSLGPGHLLHASNGRVLVRTCDPALACRLEIIDATSGERRIGPPYESGPFSQVSLSPDGQWVARTEFASGRPRLAVIGIDGRRIDLGATGFGPGAPTWSSEANWIM